MAKTGVFNFCFSVLSDECTTSNMLPHEGLRYVNNIIAEDYDRFQDIYLTEGWYRSCEMMPEEAPPDILRCGTLFPIWLNGKFLQY